MLDTQQFIEEGLGECLHLKFMQIETAFQENQLQMLKINDNFMKLQEVLGDECDFEPVDIDSMFEFTSSILDDIQNKIMMQKAKTKKPELELSQKSSSKDKSSNRLDKNDNSRLSKDYYQDKSESPLKDNTTSDFKTNRDTTEDRGYEVINAREYHKDSEFNQFESVKGSNTMTRSDNSPLSTGKYSNKPKDLSQEKPSKFSKPPTVQK